MTRSALLLAFFTVLLASSPALAEPSGMTRYFRSQRPAIGQQHYLGRLQLPRWAVKALQRVKPLGQRIVARQLVQVTNRSLEPFVQDTSRGYLEVVVPAGKGHVFFRLGREVFDFYPGGFRVGGVRPIKGERYGMLVPLRPAQERRLAAYLQRLKQTDGKELGDYDFQGETGFHCVSWIMREALAADGKNLAQLLGQQDGRPGGMVRFSRFMLKQAQPVEAVVLYSDKGEDARTLSKKKLQLMTRRQLRQAYAEGTFH